MRLLKIALIFSVALYITLIACTNILDYEINLKYVAKVMLMDDIFPESTLHSRAIQSPMLHMLAHLTILIWEWVSAFLCWFGLYVALKHYRHDVEQFRQAKKPAAVALLSLLVFFALVFFAVGGQWFASWQSKQFNAVAAVLPYFVFVGFIFIIWLQPEE